MTKHPFKKLRRKYEVSVARAKLEFAESGDNDKLWPAINDRQDKRDEAIYAALRELEHPVGKEETWQLMKFIEQFAHEHNQLGIQSEDADFLSEMIALACQGLLWIDRPDVHAKWEADDTARRCAS